VHDRIATDLSRINRTAHQAIGNLVKLAGGFLAVGLSEDVFDPRRSWMAPEAGHDLRVDESAIAGRFLIWQNAGDATTRKAMGRRWVSIISTPPRECLSAGSPAKSMTSSPCSDSKTYNAPVTGTRNSLRDCDSFFGRFHRGLTKQQA